MGKLSDNKIKSPAHSGFSDEKGYLARCFYQRVYGTHKNKYPFNIFIHSKSAAISVIAHEAVHAASFIMEEMGVIACHENDELAAYIVQHICEEAEKALGTYDN